MPTSKEHYERVLSPVYSWMYGGFPAALERNREFFEQHGIGAPHGSGIAIDLGAGCGFQSIPLAELGYAVTAIDLDPQLLAELRDNAADLPIRTIEGDLLAFRHHVESAAELIVCMTDSVLHLESPREVAALCHDAHAALEPGGRLIITFRDLTHELTGLDRFIPIRSDNETILTCFLEYEPGTVKVHDLVYHRSGDHWKFNSSYYHKLRLAPEWFGQTLAAAGFSAADIDTSRGLVTIVATR